MFLRKDSNDSSSRKLSYDDSGSDEDDIVPSLGTKQFRRMTQDGPTKKSEQAIVRPVSAKTWRQTRPGTAGSIRTYNNDLYEANYSPGDVLAGNFDDSQTTDSSRPPSSNSNPNHNSPIHHIHRLQNQKSLSAQKRAERLVGGVVSVNNNVFNNRLNIRPSSAHSQRQAQGQGPNNLSRTSSAVTDLSTNDSNRNKNMLSLAERLKSQGIKSVFDPTQESQESDKPDQLKHSFSCVNSRMQVDISDVRSFVSQPVPKGTLVQCFIVREKSSSGGLPRYVLYLEEGGRFLLAARKRRKSKTSNYLISLDEMDLERQSNTYFGKLRANFMGTEFTLFDKGYNPSRDPSQEPVGALAPRCELAQVVYEMNVLGTKGPRKMTAIIPKVNSLSNERTDFRPDFEKQQCLLDVYRKGVNLDEEVVVLRNKPPRWNEQLQVYCLNFNGRVTHASVKNFQLVSDTDMDYVVLQFGKISKDTFTMDFQWPISPLQAFGICLSSFDNKVACQ
eukprot:TRINITY_DN5620_c3_g1_i15.p1 TRINITY_DN5620_c3_g1~~TRINITY_DN5620_c3_g1_i15.p1  ORF type:complete len:502 (-),score=41.65 TRINITY_DN5620_c3_g1_i15:1321-2826(-)